MKGIEQNLPQGGNVDDGRPMRDAGCMTGVEESYGAGKSAMETGMTDRSGFGGDKAQRGDGMEGC